MFKCLVVVAHPDDELALAATIYKITHELKGIVDQVTVTNGEGGYQYSFLSEPFYNLNLTNEEVGRKNLVFIRKQELMQVRSVLKMRQLYFLNQKDTHYSLDIEEPLSVWDVAYVKDQLKTVMENHNYDVVFCLLPDHETHAHHQAVALLTLDTISTLDIKPLTLAVSVSDAASGNLKKYTCIPGNPHTRVRKNKPMFHTDRRVSLGYKDRGSYKTIVNWLIAAYKSQGGVQTLYNKGDMEDFWFLDLNNDQHLTTAENLFKQLNN